MIAAGCVEVRVLGPFRIWRGDELYGPGRRLVVDEETARDWLGRGWVSMI